MREIFKYDGISQIHPEISYVEKLEWFFYHIRIALSFNIERMMQK